ncbi:DUF2155 domain-containing protein [Pseudoprimorskyibacter insulae]|uniref:DUF2155 domain-containing protein n=1 Tax=Pseudoprimorskyibacter insulae TaxID=1695997 RepID=A0A2R8B1B9_9RHOB|nr:DUF2155 domain-containing protein [Pseudoprimorskyibacter insulae]SPF82063.1 hypothetical protein PRI8871_03891 [Pseudoprimorskyibacter insulae]
MRLRAALCAALLAVPAAAQEQVSHGTGAILRALDKVTGKVTDLDLPTNARMTFGRIEIVMTDCRFPEGNPSGDAYAFLEITEVGQEAPVFSGWMIASSPALSAMDHARYDVWVLRCTTI